VRSQPTPNTSALATPSPAGRTARLFRHGTNQAVRLPRDLEIDADEVLIHREGNRIVLTPKPRSWDDYFAGERRLGDEFPDSIEDCPSLAGRLGRCHPGQSGPLRLTMIGRVLVCDASMRPSLGMYGIFPYI
jgi:antitoxin VapB